MRCPRCSFPVPNEEHRFCTQCGTPLILVEFEEPPEPPPVALAAAQDVAGRAWQALQDVMENPRLRAYLPAQSWTLLGVLLVGLALVLSALPWFSGVGPFWSGVMVTGGLLVALRELHRSWQPLPKEVRVSSSRPTLRTLDHIPAELRHPLIPPVFAALTCAHALVMLGLGLTGFLWLLAALALGYDQGRMLWGVQQGARTASGVRMSPFRQRMERWLAAAALLCTLSLFMSWGRSSAWGSVVAGREQPLVTVTQFALLMIAVLPFLRRGLMTVPILLPVLLAVWLSLWFLLMMSPYAVGSWLFALGLLLANTIVVLHVLRRAANSGVVKPPPPKEPEYPEDPEYPEEG
jgi:hypothetical protein